MEQLEELGYSAFAFGFLEDDVQFTSTATGKCCATSEVLQYLHALIVAGNPPDIPKASPESQSSDESTTEISNSASLVKKTKASRSGASSTKTAHSSSAKSGRPKVPSTKTAHSSSAKSGRSKVPSTKTAHSKTKTANPKASSATAASFSKASSTQTAHSKTSSAKISPRLGTPVDDGDHDQSPERFSLLGSLLEPIGKEEVVTSQVELTDSPVKKDVSEWLAMSHATLYKRDKLILESSIEWLNDNIIHAAQVLLKKQFPDINGFMTPQLSKREELFMPVPPNTPFIQILNTEQSHWITISNIVPGDLCHTNKAVCLYDSGSPARVIRETRVMTCSIMKPKADTLHFDLMNIMLQPNGSDCGVFAIACATELAHGSDPTLCTWEAGNMRPHLLHCLENAVLTRFPSKQRRVPLGSRVKKSVKEDIYCTCRTINDVTRPMIECDHCRKYFHMECEGLSSTDSESYSSVKWMCSQCEKDRPGKVD